MRLRVIHALPCALGVFAAACSSKPDSSTAESTTGSTTAATGSSGTGGSGATMGTGGMGGAGTGGMGGTGTGGIGGTGTGGMGGAGTGGMGGTGTGGMGGTGTGGIGGMGGAGTGGMGGTGGAPICTPGMMTSCYTGPMGTEGVGLCAPGNATCVMDGSGYGPCQGDIVPVAETCATPGDDDCDGQTNEEGAGCVCLPNSVGPCYSGPPGTENIGKCKGGTHMCSADGTMFGPCAGEVLPAAEDCAVPGDESCDGVEVTCTGKTVWSKRFGDGLDQAGLALAPLAQGDVLYTGRFNGAIDLGGGSLMSGGAEDIFFAKLTAAGTHVFSKRYGGLYTQEPAAIALDPVGNILLTGSFYDSIGFGMSVLSAQGTDGFIAKLDSTSGFVWQKGIGEQQNNYTQRGNGVATDGAGYTYLAGDFEVEVELGGPLLVSAGLFDIFLGKLDVGGSHVWSKRFGDAADQRANDLAANGAGDLVLAGQFQGSIDFGGGLLTSAGGYDIFVAKLDAAGAHVWSKRIGGTSDDIATGVAVDASGNVVVAGSFGGSVDFGGGPLASAGATDAFLAKYTSQGTHVWSKRFGDASAQVAASVAVDALGNVLVTGSSAFFIDLGGGPLVGGGNDLFIAKFNPAGGHLWSKVAGDATIQNGLAIATDPMGRVFVAGEFQGTMDLGVGPMTSAGGFDAFLALLEP